MPITIVTGNPGKLAEWQRLFPSEFNLEAADIDLDEIQSLDLEEIAIDKAKRAFEQIGKPVIVEDVSAGLETLGWLPGPFIKYFEKQLGRDALFQLGEVEGTSARAVCTVAYFDGTNILTTKGEVFGSTAATRGENGFGFDRNFVPAGQPKTYAEMEPAEKDAISHRSIAVRELIIKLQALLSES